MTKFSYVIHKYGINLVFLVFFLKLNIFDLGNTGRNTSLPPRASSQQDCQSLGKIYEKKYLKY